MAGTYTITVLPAHDNVSVPRLELGISRVLGERHNQLDHTDGGKSKNGVSGFRSQYLVLAKDARFRLRQYPKSTPVGFEPTRAEPTHLAGELLNHSDKVSREMRPLAKTKTPRCPNAFKHKTIHSKRSGTGNRTLGICVTGRDVTNYTIPESGQPSTRIELVTLRLLSACSAN